MLITEWRTQISFLRRCRHLELGIIAEQRKSHARVQELGSLAFLCLLHLIYAANSYLKEKNRIFISRLPGLEVFTSRHRWAAYSPRHIRRHG